MDQHEVSSWFEQYVSDFAEAGRGERPPAEVVGHYSAPLLLTTDEVVVRVATREDLGTWLQTQVDGMVAAGYDRTETLSTEVTVLNGSTAILRGSFSRLRADGEQISALTVTYLIARDPDDLRIAAMVVHTP